MVQAVVQVAPFCYDVHWGEEAALKVQVPQGVFSKGITRADGSETTSRQTAPQIAEQQKTPDVVRAPLDNERTQPRQTDSTFGHVSNPTATQRKTHAAALPSDLATVVAAWATLPDALRAGIVAMVKASGPK